MTSWIRQSFDQIFLEEVLQEASIREIDASHNVQNPNNSEKDDSLRFIANMLELSVLELLDKGNESSDLIEDSADCFKSLKVLPLPTSQKEALKECLKISCLGIIGNKELEVQEYLNCLPLSEFQEIQQNWREIVLYSTFEVWLHLIHNDNEHLKIAMNLIKKLKEMQKEFETKYFDEISDSKIVAAWELASVYHMLTAARLLADYKNYGIDNKRNINDNLESQFSLALKACERADLLEFRCFIKLISFVSQKLGERRNFPIKRPPHSISRYNNIIPFITLPSLAVCIPAGFHPFFSFDHNNYNCVRVIHHDYNTEISQEYEANKESFLCYHYSVMARPVKKSFNNLFAVYDGLRDNKGIYNMLQEKNESNVCFLKNKTPFLLFIKEIQMNLEEDGIDSSITILNDRDNILSERKHFISEIEKTKTNAFCMIIVSCIQQKIEVILPEDINRVTYLNVDEKIHLEQDTERKELILIGDISMESEEIPQI